MTDYVGPIRDQFNIDRSDLDPNTPTFSPVANPQPGRPDGNLLDQWFYQYYGANPAALSRIDPSAVPQSALTNPAWANPIARSWGLDQALNAGMTQAGPQFANNQTYRDQLAGQIGMTNASQSAQTDYLNQDYNTGLSRLDLQQKSQGIQKNALGRQPQYLATLHDLANQLLNQSADTARRGATSSAIARGANTSIGFNQQLGDINSQLANQLAQSDTRYAEQQASVADQNAALDLQAKDLGLSRDALKTELSRGLDRLGLSSMMSVADLTGKLNSSQVQDQVIAQQIFNEAMQSSDYYAQHYPGFNPAVPPGPQPEPRPRVGAS